MSDEQVTAAPETPAAPEAPPASAAPEGQPQQGTDWLDFNKLPPEIRGEVEPRFKRIYGHMKESERKAVENDRAFRTLAEHNKALEDRLSKFERERLEEKQGDYLSSIKTAIKQAAEDGDYDRVANLTEKLVEVKAAAKAEPMVQKVQEEKPTALSSAQEADILAWTNEIDDRGDMRRPWTHDGHPLQARAASMVTAVMQDPRFKGRPVREILSEVDRLMGLDAKPRAAAATVLSGDGNVRPARGESLTLSADQKRVAERLYDNLSADEAHKRYAKQLKALGKI